jgi:hypothetical protein
LGGRRKKWPSSGKNKEVFKPFKSLDPAAKEKAERKGNIVGKGHAYLENDRQERKATGSYYTPDYIVKYIVDRTVGPTLQTKLDALRRVSCEGRRTAPPRDGPPQAISKRRACAVKKDPPPLAGGQGPRGRSVQSQGAGTGDGFGAFSCGSRDFVTRLLLAF